MAKSRRMNVFSLSFLDVMSCGFGAVVLIFLIINHSTDDDAKQLNRDLLSESRRLDYEMLTGSKNLVDLQKELEDKQKRVEEARRKLVALMDDAERRKFDLDELEALTIAQREAIEELQSDVETREKDVKQLKAKEDANAGSAVRVFEGDGNRQYLTGLYVGGTHVLIAVDGSASMLDQTIVNVIRRRNMPKERKLQSPKWQRAIRTVEWLSAQIPLDSNFQIVTFNTETKTLLPSQSWYESTDSTALDDAISALQEFEPTRGTSLESLFTTISQMNPLPDNVYLIVDSLPTQGAKPPRNPTITGRQRLQLFQTAVNRLPPQVPVNVIMFPMEGDPMAAASYWNLAQITRGAFLAPSTDWP